MFADQFEEDGTGFIYRKSQKGAAIRVSAEERSRFLQEFDQNSRRATWAIYVGLGTVAGGMILLPAVWGWKLPEPAMVAAVIVAMIPYTVYYKWVWAAPARELEGRTPLAGERSPEEVQHLRFRRITYKQLGTAALGGLALPFLISSREDAFSGWNRLWLVFGGALVLIAAVQAFRKWRFEQKDPYKNIIPGSSSIIDPSPAEDDASSAKSQIWRYVPLALIVGGGAFIAFTPAGKKLANTPIFWPLVMIGVGGWSLFSVVHGFTKGQIEPFARGFYYTYQRETQPKRFWTSMAWNGFFGCLCLWVAFTMMP